MHRPSDRWPIIDSHGQTILTIDARRQTLNITDKERRENRERRIEGFQVFHPIKRKLKGDPADDLRAALLHTSELVKTLPDGNPESWVWVGCKNPRHGRPDDRGDGLVVMDSEGREWEIGEDDKASLGPKMDPVRIDDRGVPWTCKPFYPGYAVPSLEIRYEGGVLDLFATLGLSSSRFLSEFLPPNQTQEANPQNLARVCHLMAYLDGQGIGKLFIPTALYRSDTGRIEVGKSESVWKEGEVLTKTPT